MKMTAKVLLMTAIVFAMMFQSACLIYEVDQPATVAAGGVFETTVSISDINAETSNPHKGALCMLVPDDWTFVSGTYDSDVGTGDIFLDPNQDSPVYGLIDTVIVPPADMKWVKMLSDTGYTHDANVYHDAFITFQVGQKGGDFPIGYMVTVNTIDMFGFFADNDIDDGGSSGWGDGVDTLMNQWVTVTGGTAVEQVSSVASEFKLAQNFPNPFNPTTNIQFEIPENSFVTLTVYDLMGQEVTKLVNDYRAAGSYSVTFDGAELSSGIYFYKLQAGNLSKTMKMVLAK
ncbi:MAG: T9SS type A sorting domain-containing protein [Candidatus Marinimicrobia bacterium]|nr:T9SS type A sorting domain-containing protein [Candidatus Neomarinimicrobiota bacterium]